MVSLSSTYGAQASASASCSCRLLLLIPVRYSCNYLFENEGFSPEVGEIPAKRLWERPLLPINEPAIIILLFNSVGMREK
jgi:hypothetical protein